MSKYYSIAPSLLLIPLLTPLHIANIVDPTIIKCSKYHIYKPRLNFIKDGPLKKLLKLCQLYQLKARLPYILLLLLLTFPDLQI